MTNYKKQYLKYKKKYLKIKKMFGGSDKQLKIKKIRMDHIFRARAAVKAADEAAVKAADEAADEADESVAKSAAEIDEEADEEAVERDSNFTKIGTGLTFIGGLIAVLVIILKN